MRRLSHNALQQEKITVTVFVEHVEIKFGPCRTFQVGQLRVYLSARMLNKKVGLVVYISSRQQGR